MNYEENSTEAVSAIIKALDLDKKTEEEKLYSVLNFLRKIVDSNISLKEENECLKDQILKGEETKTAFKKLIEALRAQVDLTKEENELKLKEEAHKRLECSLSFEKQMTELQSLVDIQTNQNSKLQTENQEIAIKLIDLIKAYEEESKLHTERHLQIQLYEAQLNKAKIEKAEISTGYTQERLELQKLLLELREENDLYRRREALMKEQVSLYQQQCQEVEKNLGDSGSNIQHFRNQIEKLTLKLHQVECDTSEWKHKFEASNDQVKKMNMLSFERDKEMEILKKKLSTMENLNRALNSELKKVKECS